MALTFRRAMPSERDELERVVRAAFTPYLRALGHEYPAYGSAEFAARMAQGEVQLERGDVYVALDADHIVGAVATERQ